MKKRIVLKKWFLLFSCSVIFLGCSTSDYQSLARAALSQNPDVVLKSFATSKGVQYATNPKKLESDLKSLDKSIGELFSVLIGEASKNWGKENVKTPSKKEYVKYMQNYKSRAMVDFDSGIVSVETLDNTNPKQSLKQAIVTTLLLPEDPRSADLFDANDIKLGDTPYLFGEIQDDQGKNIRYEWRANRFADVLIKNSLQSKTITNASKKEQVYFVQIPMIKDHASVRVAKFKPFVQKYAKLHGVSENLVYAIIKTESDFNQFAISSAGAIGLMQIVPSSAGVDAYKYAKGKTWTPTRSYLFDAKNNIELGSAYLSIIDKQYLKGVQNGISREYCVISAYNTGSGNVLKTFHTDREKAKSIINTKKPSEVYSTLRAKLPYDETKRYLYKVIQNKKAFVNL
jgi:membrane-bound lytic murein transglycosylase C